jgi:hypothetical protein
LSVTIHFVRMSLEIEGIKTDSALCFSKGGVGNCSNIKHKSLSLRLIRRQAIWN